MSKVVSEELKIARYPGYLLEVKGYTMTFEFENGLTFTTTSNELHHKKKLRRYLRIVGFEIELISKITDRETLNGMVTAHIVDRLLINLHCRLDEFGNGKIVDIQEFSEKSSP